MDGTISKIPNRLMILTKDIHVDTLIRRILINILKIGLSYQNGVDLDSTSQNLFFKLEETFFNLPFSESCL